MAVRLTVFVDHLSDPEEQPWMSEGVGQLKYVSLMEIPASAGGPERLDLYRFLTYIVQNYDDIPQLVMFLSDHSSVWRPINLREALGAVRIPSDFKYHCLTEDFTCYADAVDVPPHVEQRLRTWKTVLQDEWRPVFEDVLGPKPVLGRRWCENCCAQFVVSGNAIRRHSKQYYLNALQRMTESLSADGANRVSEDLACFWSVLFDVQRCFPDALVFPDTLNSARDI